MVQSLQNTTATPKISVSSLTTTVPSILQGTYSVACSQIWSTACSGQGASWGASQPCHCPAPATVPKFPPRGAGEVLYTQGLFYPTAKIWAARVLWNWDCKLHQWSQSAPHCGHSQRGQLKNGTNNWFTHCQRIFLGWLFPPQLRKTHTRTQIMGSYLYVWRESKPIKHNLSSLCHCCMLLQLERYMHFNTYLHICSYPWEVIRTLTLDS